MEEVENYPCSGTRSSRTFPWIAAPIWISNSNLRVRLALDADRMEGETARLQMIISNSDWVKKLVIAFFLYLSTGVASADWWLPPCPENSSYKNNCIGSSSNNGFSYSVEFKDGKMNGKGNYFFPNGEKYNGEFKNGKYNGQGTYTWPDGEKYMGEYKDGFAEGSGTTFLPSGGKYIGEFKGGKRHGEGIEYKVDGSILLFGSWENDKYLSNHEVKISSTVESTFPPITPSDLNASGINLLGESKLIHKLSDIEKKAS